MEDDQDESLVLVAVVWFVAGMLSMGAFMAFSTTLTPIGTWLMWFILIMTMLAVVVWFMRGPRQ